eukprot:3444664-Amphidinium_carterae.1
MATHVSCFSGAEYVGTTEKGAHCSMSHEPSQHEAALKRFGNKSEMVFVGTTSSNASYTRLIAMNLIRLPVYA